MTDELDGHRKHGKKIVATNGCFDVLHRGHIEYLNFCKAAGDIVVVGLNSDASVKVIKGPDRPINNQHDRAVVLAALQSVDYVVIFDEPDPLELISSLKPHILVKGGDWTPETTVGREVVEGMGGKVVITPQIQGISTSTIIDRIVKREERNQ